MGLSTACTESCIYMYVCICVHTGLQVKGDKMTIEPPSNSDDRSSPKESTGPVWTSYADSYFEGDFAAPFSDLEEEATSSGSSDSPLLENNQSMCEDQPTPPVENTVDSVESEIDCKLTFGGQRLLSQSVDSESPLSVSSADSPEHPSSGGSQVERSVHEVCSLGTFFNLMCGVRVFELE